MKVHIEIVENLAEDEVVIRCARITGTIQSIHQAITEQASVAPKLTFHKKSEEYYFPLEDVLFFETGSDQVYAHTADDVFRVKYRLWELEEFLPKAFARISKSGIVNTRHILSIDRDLTASSLVRFHKSHKQVYVSRMYYKSLRQRLESIRNS